MPGVQHAQTGGVTIVGQRWKEFGIATDGTHHLHQGIPAYAPRFHEVLKFHSPGLAPVVDGTGAYHVTPDGQPAYQDRYRKTFGFYEDRAAVQSEKGWLHILPSGGPLYSERYDWCGNFQQGRCPVRNYHGQYFHIKLEGTAAYEEKYRYAGDFRDGFAVVQREDGHHTHIDELGHLVHGRWFLDLDVFHKNYARACDRNGWHHVDSTGKPLYEGRFKAVEPFYNGQARVESYDGALSVIDETGDTLIQLRTPSKSPLEELSTDMVGVWKTQAIGAAVSVGIFESLPSSAEDLEKACRLGESMVPRLLRGLLELGLVWRDSQGIYHTTDKGAPLSKASQGSMAPAALHWSRHSSPAWHSLELSLRSGEPYFERTYGENFFDWLQHEAGDLKICKSALASYARHDYQALADAVDFGVHDSVFDVGGGTGELAFALLRLFPKLVATVMDRPEVIGNAKPPEDLASRCSFIPGDFFKKWPVTADAVILARVLHDWPDNDAVRILRRAREVLTEEGILYVVEMALDDSGGAGGLLDLNMLVMTGGRERTQQQFEVLFKRAGFRLMDVVQTGAVHSILLAKPA